MDIKVLVFAMCLILFSLYTFAKYYRPKEKLQMKLEASYIEGLKEYHATQSDSLEKKIFDLGIKYGEALGMTEENTLKMIHKDLGQKTF